MIYTQTFISTLVNFILTKKETEIWEREDEVYALED